MSILFVLLVNDQNAYTERRVSYTGKENIEDTPEEDKLKRVFIAEMEAAQRGLEEAESEEDDEEEQPPALPTKMKQENKEELKPMKEEDGEEEKENQKDEEDGDEEKKIGTTSAVLARSTSSPSFGKSEEERDEEMDEEQKKAASEPTETTKTTPIERNESDSVTTTAQRNSTLENRGKGKETTKVTTTKVAATSRVSRLPVSSTGTPKDIDNKATNSTDSKELDKGNDGEEIDGKYQTLPELRYFNSSKTFSKKYYPLLEELGNLPFFVFQAV